MLLDWNETYKYASLLLKESKWSRTIYGYQKSSVLLMVDEELTQEQQEEIDTIMKYARFSEVKVMT